MSVVKSSGREVLDRWPQIARFLHVHAAGEVEHDLTRWSFEEPTLSPAEQAAALEQWADFFEWRLAQRADELAGDRNKRNLVEKWTDSMAYCCRRSASWARGDDPGEWIPQWERRPDLEAVSRAIVSEIIAALDADNDHEVDCPLIGAGLAR